MQPARGATGGTFVRHPDPDVLAATMGETVALWFHTGSTTLAEVDAARAWIEEGCVRIASHVRTEADVAAIRAAVEAMEPPPERGRRRPRHRPGLPHRREPGGPQGRLTILYVI